MTTQQQSKQRQAKRAQPMKNVKKKPSAERWRLYRTLEATTPYTIPYTTSTTPYSDTYRKVYALLTDELLCLNSSEAKSGVKLRTQEKTVNKPVTSVQNFVAIVKLYVYLKV